MVPLVVTPAKITSVQWSAGFGQHRIAAARQDHVNSSGRLGKHPAEPDASTVLGVKNEQQQLG